MQAAIDTAMCRWTWAVRFVKVLVELGMDLHLHVEPAYEIVWNENEKGSLQFHFF